MKTEQPTAMCPYCEAILDKRPQRKKKCPECDNYIYVKTLPTTQEKVLVTESQASEIDAEWARRNWRQRWLTSLFSLGISEANFEQVKSRISAKLKKDASDKDVVWSLLNQAIQNNSDDFNLLHRIHYTMALFLDEEKRDFKPLLVDAARLQIMYYKQRGVSEVRIMSAGAGNSCESCQKQDGKIYTVDEALRLMPIPCDECAKPGLSGQLGFCRCQYMMVANF